MLPSLLPYYTTGFHYLMICCKEQSSKLWRCSLHNFLQFLISSSLSKRTACFKTGNFGRKTNSMCFSALIFIGFILAGKQLPSMHRPAPTWSIILSIRFLIWNIASVRPAFCGIQPRQYGCSLSVELMEVLDLTCWWSFLHKSCSDAGICLLA